ncbi:MAG: hypothetical protein ACFCVC_17555 [Acidimicrobiia bacterium]
MTAVYAIVLVVGCLALIGWIVAHSFAESTGRPDRDPERRFGVGGRRLAGGLVGFGMAGMSAEFASIEISAPLAAMAAVTGAAAAAWWAGAMGGAD